MLVKYISENLVRQFPGFIKENGVVFTNQSAEEKASLYGYKELITDDEPEYDRESQYLTQYYVEEDNCIKKCWKIENMEVTDNVL